MYIVRDKASKQVLHVNPAPLSQRLSGSDIYYRFDPETMEVGKTEGPVPDRFEIDEAGQIIRPSLEERVAAGDIELAADQVIRDGRIRPKTLAERVASGDMVLGPSQKLVSDESGERIVEKTLAEQIAEGTRPLAPGEKLISDESGERIVEKTLDEQLAEGVLTREALRERCVQSLRAEVEQHYMQARTPGGYRLDALARQKATLSWAMNGLPEGDPARQRLIDAGMVFPQKILDEITDGVAAVQAAYRKAREALDEASGGDGSAETMTAISLASFLAK